MKLKKDEPHLKEVFDLYDKVREFDASVMLGEEYSLDGSNTYAGSDAEAVVGAFLRVFDLSPEEAEQIKGAIENGELDFMALRDLGGAKDDKLFSIKYVLGRPFFRSLNKTPDVEDVFWEDGRCPVCAARPSVSVLQKEYPRKYFCSFCGTVGKYKRIGCPSCGAEDAAAVDIIFLEEREDVRLDLCNSCRSYVKTFDAHLLAEHSLEELDLMSLPYDIVAQKKGFRRPSPNPVGIIDMAG